MCSALSTSIYDIDYFYFKISQLSCDNHITFNTKPSFISEKRHGIITAEELSDKWMIGPKQALLTLQHTTQRGIRSALFPLSRRYRGDLFYQKRRLAGKWYTDTFHGRHKTIEGNTCAQIFANKQLFAISYPLTSKRFAGEALKLFISQFGVPEYLTYDGATEQCGTKTLFHRQIVKHGIKKHLSEPHRPN